MPGASRRRTLWNTPCRITSTRYRWHGIATLLEVRILSFRSLRPYGDLSRTSSARQIHFLHAFDAV